jgi:hypothetical protein
MNFTVLFVDISELEEAKKASEVAAAQQVLQQQNQQLGTNQSTPDYAVGLTAMNPPTPAPATPSYSPATPQHTVTTIIAIPRDAAGEGHCKTPLLHPYLTSSLLSLSVHKPTVRCVITLSVWELVANNITLYSETPI